MLLTNNRIVLFTIIELYLVGCIAKTRCFIDINFKRIYGRAKNIDDGPYICQYTNIPYAWKPGRFEQSNLKPLEETDKESFKKIPKLCIQGMRDSMSGQENCLYLNIYSLWSINATENHPVLVYLHGGTFNVGSPQEDINDIVEFLKKDIIFVTVHYRLGLFGFSLLSSGEIEANLGLKDQTVALQWIRQYIHYFNGDRRKVTLGGWSAGGAAVTYHLYSHKSRYLFNRAIAISGTFLNPWAFNSRTNVCTLKLCAKLKISNCTKSALQKLSVDELIPEFSIDLHFYHFGIMFSCFLPSIDTNGYSVSTPPYILLREKPINDVPLLMGYTSLEEACDVELGNEFSMQNYPFSSGSVNILQSFEIIRELVKTKGKPEEIVHLRRVADMLHGILKFAESYSTVADNPLYLYRFALSYNRERQCASTEEGALHGDDMKFLFWKNATAGNKRHIKIRSELIQLWIDFIKFGTPSPDSDLRIQWLPYKTVNRTVLNIGRKLTVKYQKQSRYYRFWDKFKECIEFDKCMRILDELQNGLLK